MKVSEQTESLTTWMVAGIWYRVVKGSKNGKFKLNDLVKLEDDGSLCFYTLDWIDWVEPEDVREATRGWEVAPDVGWILAELSVAEKYVALLKSALPPPES